MCSALAETKALGIEVQDHWSVDKKEAAQVFMAENEAAAHNYVTLRDALAALECTMQRGEGKAWCTHHQTKCPMPDLPITLWTCGFPCSPYSSQRSKRFSDGRLS